MLLSGGFKRWILVDFFIFEKNPENATPVCNSDVVIVVSIYWEEL
jgi:hypothetical protein